MGTLDQNTVPADRFDLRCLRAIRHIIRSVDLHSQRLSSQHGVTVPQLVALRNVAERGPSMLKDLARATHLSASTMVGIVDRLEAKGWVIRQRSTADRRQSLISVTPEGLALLERTPLPLQDALVKGMSTLPGHEQVAIVRSLERLVDLLDVDIVPDASPILVSGAVLEEAGSGEAAPANLAAAPASAPAI